MGGTTGRGWTPIIGRAWRARIACGQWRWRRGEGYGSRFDDEARRCTSPRRAPRGRHGRRRSRVGMTPWLLGWVAGTAAQLQQAQLWPCGAYQALLAAALLGVPVAGWLGRCGLRCPREGWAGIWLLCGALAGAGWAGARAAAHASDLLAPALEEAVLLVSGRVAGLPQRHADGGQRFAFDLTGARRPMAAPCVRHRACGWPGTRRARRRPGAHPPSCVPETTGGCRCGSSARTASATRTASIASAGYESRASVPRAPWCRGVAGRRRSGWAHRPAIPSTPRARPGPSASPPACPMPGVPACSRR
jgi:hypothetical protein